ncbi:MAG: hypothetical protein JWL73_3334 [Actinomycetia bacterium]|nr:hypothetical protein [Actinomycetes bacterium]
MAKQGKSAPVTAVSEPLEDVKQRIEAAVDQVTAKVAETVHPED